MRILVIDTTSSALNLVLSNGKRSWSRRVDAPGRQDERIFPEVDRLLRKAGLKLKDIEGIAAAAGPGSFTGIRIGLTFASVLSETLQVPAVPITLFEVEAFRLARSGKLRPKTKLEISFPGPRGEEYRQVFGVSAAGRILPSGKPQWVAAQPGIQSAALPVPKSEVLVKLALEKLGSKKKEKLQPLYLKPAYYERNAH